MTIKDRIGLIGLSAICAVCAGRLYADCAAKCKNANGYRKVATGAVCVGYSAAQCNKIQADDGNDSTQNCQDVSPTNSIKTYYSGSTCNKCTNKCTNVPKTSSLLWDSDGPWTGCSEFSVNQQQCTAPKG